MGRLGGEITEARDNSFCLGGIERAVLVEGGRSLLHVVVSWGGENGNSLPGESEVRKSDER